MALCMMANSSDWLNNSLEERPQRSTVQELPMAPELNNWKPPGIYDCHWSCQINHTGSLSVKDYLPCCLTRNTWPILRSVCSNMASHGLLGTLKCSVLAPGETLKSLLNETKVAAGIHKSLCWFMDTMVFLQCSWFSPPLDSVKQQTPYEIWMVASAWRADCSSHMTRFKSTLYQWSF